MGRENWERNEGRGGEWNDPERGRSSTHPSTQQYGGSQGGGWQGNWGGGSQQGGGYGREQGFERTYQQNPSWGAGSQGNWGGSQAGWGGGFGAGTSGYGGGQSGWSGGAYGPGAHGQGAYGGGMGGSPGFGGQGPGYGGGSYGGASPERGLHGWTAGGGSESCPTCGTSGSTSSYGRSQSQSFVGGIQGGQTFRGKGPKGYRRSDDRIREEVSDRLMDDPEIDASDIEVSVSEGTVTLSGNVNDRRIKHRADDLVENVLGVKDVENKLRVKKQSDTERREGRESEREETATGARGRTGQTATSGGRIRA